MQFSLDSCVLQQSSETLTPAASLRQRWALLGIFFLFYNDGAAFSVAVIPTLRVSVCVCVCVLDSFYSLPFQVAISALFFFFYPLHRCTHFSSFLKNKLKEPNNEIGSCNVVAVRCPSPNK